MEGFMLAVVAMAIFVLGVAIGSTSTNAHWRDDCADIGNHRTSDKAVWKCEKVK